MDNPEEGRAIKDPWMIFTNPIYGSISVTAVVDGMPVGGGPTFESRDDVDRFIAALQAERDEVFAEQQPRRKSWNLGLPRIGGR